MRTKLLLVAAAALLAAGCGDAQNTPAAKEEATARERRDTMLTITSSAFKAGERIPRKHTGEGADVSPPLAWTGAPAGTREFALVCDDPDAPTPQPWVHWVLYKVPGDRTSLAEGSADSALQGKTSFGHTRYGGPMPPPGHGVHRYYFKLYALDAPVNLKPGATKEELLAAMKGHVLAQAELIGTYERK